MSKRLTRRQRRNAKSNYKRMSSERDWYADALAHYNSHTPEFTNWGYIKATAGLLWKDYVWPFTFVTAIAALLGFLLYVSVVALITHK